MYKPKVGEIFGELTVCGFTSKPNTDKYKTWCTNNWVKCSCSCGKFVEIPVFALVRGLIKSCGHYKAEKATETIKQNRPDNAVNITYNGITMNKSNWSNVTGIPRSTINYRLKQNKPLNEVFNKGAICEENV